MEKGVKLQLYRTLLRRAKRATSGKHLFRFQDDCTSAMWGQNIMYDPNNDILFLKRIFPESTHAFIDNSFEFGDNSVYRRSYIHQKSQQDLRTDDASQEPPIIQQLTETIAKQQEQDQQNYPSKNNGEDKSQLFTKYQPNLATKIDPRDQSEYGFGEDTTTADKSKYTFTKAQPINFTDHNLDDLNVNEGYIPRQIYPTPLSSSLSNYIVTEYDRTRLNSLLYNIFKHYSNLDNIPKIEIKKRSKKQQKKAAKRPNTLELKVNTDDSDDDNNDDSDSSDNENENENNQTSKETNEKKENDSNTVNTNTNENISDNRNSNKNSEGLFYFQPDVTEQSLIADGFSALTEFDRQIEINECTSIAEASGIRVIVTSRHCPEIMHPDRSKPHAFTYRIRVENHGHEWVQLVGRHWIIEDENGNKDVVERFAPGVVGKQPGLESGDIFMYGSGVFLATPNGIMRGSFQFNEMDGTLFEVPVAPFRLIAEQENRN